MTRYFKQYINSNKAVEINKTKAIDLLCKYYKDVKKVLEALPLEQKIRTPWAIFWKVQTK